MKKSDLVDFLGLTVYEYLPVEGGSEKTVGERGGVVDGRIK